MKQIMLAMFMFFALSAGVRGEYEIGVYYFPGWTSPNTDSRPGDRSTSSVDAWAPIRAFGSREPKLGWYDDSDTRVMQQQLTWMSEYAIDYVAFDWYWSRGRPFLNHSIDAYFKTSARSKVKFSILWANHDAIPRSMGEFDSMVRFWIDNYLARPEIYRIDGKPVVFILSHENLDRQAATFGETAQTLVRRARSMVESAGLPGLYIVGSTFTRPTAAEVGYDATSAYNHHGFQRNSHSYAELVADYSRIWEVQVGRQEVPYIVPMTQGWDRRPWGGSQDRAHDRSGGDPVTFREHLKAARAFMDLHRSKTMGRGIICCWNEYGEGSYIEPTKTGGFDYLEVNRSVFGP